MQKRPAYPLLLLLSTVTLSAHAQSSTSEAQAVKKTITTFFDGMRRGDSTLVRSTLAPNALFHAISQHDGRTALQLENPTAFLKAIGTPHPETWDERVQFERVLIDANLASVWAPYEFYLGSKFSHCGYDSFQLIKLAEGWKIAHIIDTRRKEKCK